MGPLSQSTASSSNPVSPQTQSQAEELSETIPPDFSGNQPPTYPLRARRLGWEGTVLLRVFVAEDGRVTKVEVVKPSGRQILDAAAVNAVRRWRGTPATRDGKPVASSWKIPFEFRLP